MVALVEHGAPRDFRDIYALCQANLTTPNECWQLWRKRQTLAGNDIDPNRVRLALETHLIRIALHLPWMKLLVPSKSRKSNRAAWDFGVLPTIETVTEIRHPSWREAVDKCRLLTSPAYHLVRSWHNLPNLPYLGQELAYIRDDPSLAFV